MHKILLNELSESTRIALDQILSSKMRSFLSALGVVIGISVVIIMGWLIMALDDVVENTFQMLGADMLWVSRFDWAGSKSWEEVRSRKPLTYKMCQEFKEKMHYAELVTIQATAWGGTVKYDGEAYNGITIEGDDYNFQYTSNGEIVEGRYFSLLEDDHGGNVVVIGAKVKEAIFPNENAIGKRINIMGQYFTVIGVLKKQGTVMMDFIDKRVCLPLATFLKIYGINRDFSVGVKAGGQERLEEVRYETEGIMRSIRNVSPWQDNDFSINETKTFEETTKTIRASVYGVGIGMTMLSFLVGIIGIMNIMFVSVTERTKEIGIRKAIGAKSRTILLQFIIEAVALCLIGAIASFIFSSILIYVAATILHHYKPSTAFLQPYLPFNLLAIATFISVIVGVLAGLIPAIRASKLEPVDALRWE